MEDAKNGHFFRMLQDSVEMHESEEFPGEFETDVAAFLDPRTQAMGVRVLCVEESLELEESNLMRKLDDPEEYDLIRTMLGIPESSAELGG